MRKHFYYIGIILFLLLIFITDTAVVSADGFDLEVEEAILIDADTGQVLFEKNADTKLAPASITKIMTLLITMEKTEDGSISLDDEITVSRFAESMGGSQIFLAADTRIKLQDLLKAITIASANDASVAVAESIAGTYNNFVSMMNKKVQALGMKNTHFVNSTGLPPEHGEHYSTARDISIMARELVKYPKVLEWASIWVDYLKLPGREAMLVNTNKLINKYPGMDGLKTGHTEEAGYCLAATAKRNEMRLISVIMKGESEAAREENTVRLLDYGFNSFSRELIVNKGYEVHNVKVPNGKKMNTVVEAVNDLTVVVKKGTKDTLHKEIVIKDNIEAPIKTGDILGKLTVVQNDKVLGEVNLLATEDIEKAGLFTRIWRSFVNWIGGFIEKIFN